MPHLACATMLLASGLLIVIRDLGEKQDAAQ